MYKYIKIITFVFIIILFNNYCKKENEYLYIVSKNGLVLREKPTTKSNKITLIPYEEKVLILDKNGPKEEIYGINAPWYKIKHNDKLGWSFSGFLSKELPVYFGIVYKYNILRTKNNKVREGNPFRHFFMNGKFYENKIRDENNFNKYNSNILKFLTNYKKNQTYIGFDKIGNKHNISLSDVVGLSGGMYDTHLLFDNKKNSIENIYMIFASNDNIINIISSKPYKLDQNGLLKLKSISKIMIKSNKESYINNYQDVDFKKEKVDAIVFKNKNYKTVYIPTIIKFKRTTFLSSENNKDDNVYNDERGGVFFILNQKNEIIYKSFGHPEWGPEAKKVISIYPILYFSLVGYPNLLALTDFEYGWESIGHAIIDIEKGRILSKSL